MTGGAPLQMRFTGADLPRLRLRVGDAAGAAGLDESRREELVLAVYEPPCNAILHGGGGERLLLSRVEGSVRCQVSDDGARLRRRRPRRRSMAGGAAVGRD